MNATPKILVTARQRQVLAFLRDYIRRVGMPPTIREIGHELGVGSPNAVVAHLRALVRKGLVRHAGRNLSRGYLPVYPDGTCPCCGRPLDIPPTTLEDPP